MKNILPFFILTGLFCFFSTPSKAQCRATFYVETNNRCYDGTSVVLQDSSRIIAGLDTLKKEVWIYGDGYADTISFGFDYYRIHPYNPGVYNCKLKIFTKSGCTDSLTRTVTVYGLPHANFFVVPMSMCQGLPISFVNTSSIVTGSITGYTWDFGDAATSNVVNPSHVFSAPLVYNVKLIATSEGGCKDSVIKTVSVGATPQPDFSYALGGGGEVSFVDMSVVNPGTITGYGWDFGDATGSTIKDPGHTYGSPGTYPVTLTVNTDAGCSNAITKDVIVYDVASPCTPKAGVYNSSACAGGIVNFYDSSFYYQGTDSLRKEIWDFGDGIRDTVSNNFADFRSHRYSTYGNFVATVTGFTKSGCFATKSMPVTINPRPVAKFGYTVQGCSPPYTATFTDSSTIIMGALTGHSWNFGDGHLAAGVGPQNNYNSIGSYTVSLIALSDLGCRDTVVHVVTMPTIPVSAFTYTKDLVDSQKVQFNDISTSSGLIINQWYWNFGDGTYGSNPNPLHIYPNRTADYTVRHSAISFACNGDTVSQVVHIDSSYSPVTRQGNTGKEFWAGFGYHEKMSRKSGDAIEAQTSFYITTGNRSARVTVSLPGVPGAAGFPKLVLIPANSSAEVTGFPTGSSTVSPNVNPTGLPDARLYYTGVSERAIHITSTEPVSVWQHIYSVSNAAGATLLLPVDVWGNDYYVQTIGGKTNTGIAASFFYVIAKEDSTIIHFTPPAPIVDSSAATVFQDNHTAANILYNANSTYSIQLNKGEVFNAMGMVTGTGTNAATGVDLSGTRVNADDPLKKIAVFAGNGRVIINTANCINTTGSDNLVQQMYPKIAWGNRYFTTPTKTMEYNVFRVLVTDTSTLVKVNGIPLTGLINGRYYQFENNRPNLIEADKRIMVTQFIVTPNCPTAFSGDNGSGDPEMIILSPLKYSINNANIYSPNFKSGTAGASFINVVVRKEGIANFLLDGQSAVADTGTNSYLSVSPYGSSASIPVAAAFRIHPSDSSYAYARFKVATGQLHSLLSDSSFTAIGYGLIGGESNGFNAGFNFNSSNLIYTFTGSGNWSNPANWLNNMMPPSTIPMGAQVIILPGTTCMMDVPVIVEDGANLAVESGANLIINGNLTIIQ